MDINICGRRKLTINNKCYSIVGKTRSNFKIHYKKSYY